MLNRLFFATACFCVVTPALAQNPRVLVNGDDSATVSEGIKMVQASCSGLTVNEHANIADYVMTVSDDGSGAARKGRRALVSKRDGDVLSSIAARKLKSAVKDACSVIEKDWSSAHQ
jgi:hypothetical protein